MTKHRSFRTRLPGYATAISSALALLACSDSTAPIIPAKYLVTASKGTSEVTTAVVGDTILVKAQLVDANDRPAPMANRRLVWYFTSGTDAQFTSPISGTDNNGVATNYLVLGSKANVSEQIIVQDEHRLVGTSPRITVTAGPPAQYTVTAGTLSAYAGSSIPVRAQLTDRAGNQSQVAGRVVTWSVAENGGGYYYERGVRTNRLVAPTRGGRETTTGTFASATSTTDNHGVATVDFNVGTTIGTSFTIVAQDDQKATGVTAAISILAGPPTKFTVTVSVTDPPAGAVVALTAYPSDAYGNAVPVVAIPVSWSVSGAGGTLASAVTSTNQSGIATNQLTTAPTSGTSYTITVNNGSQTGASPTVTTQQQVSLASLASGFGWATSCGVASDGAVWCWGNQDSGSLPARPLPGKPDGNQAVSALSTSGFHTCAISSGTVSCWGKNDVGQLGDNSHTDRATAAPINSPLSFTAVSTGSGHTCALATSGDIYCWGQSASGRLGDGTGFNGLGPVKVGGGHSFTALSAGRAHTCAISTTGDVYCWGSNQQGQLGNGSFVDQSTPSLVSGGLSFSAIAAGDSHTCGVSSGSIYCWGDNTFGEVGNGGVPLSVTLPAHVRTAGTFTTVAAGGFHSCAIASNATGWCWGDNTSRELGDPNFTQNAATTPVAVAGGLTFKSIAIGGGGSSSNDYYYGPSASGHSCGLTTDGVAYCWGSNGSGELGSGSFGLPIGAPTKVSGQP